MSVKEMKHMLRHDPIYDCYCEILKSELQMATGCTEPIALAYCAAKARAELHAMPERVLVRVSGNIIKNVKSVTVPNTGGLKGIKAAVAAGIVAGNENGALQVLACVNEEQYAGIKHFLENTPIRVESMDNGDLLDMEVTVYAGPHHAAVHICKSHTHIQEILFDGSTRFCDNMTISPQDTQANYSLLDTRRICEFAGCLEIEDLDGVIERQIECNTAIANEGLRAGWGADIGGALLQAYGQDVRIRARALAAAGSDARMSGCEMPVVINSGSGNQGLTVSLPVIEYAKEYGKSDDELQRALAVANLCAIHQKAAIGKLSAFCGAVTAGSAAGAGIAYLLTKDCTVVEHTIVNALAIVSGMICDGAKPSCAAKISSAIDAAILGFEMFQRGHEFYGGDGILSKGIENTISNVGKLGREGMRETDRKILEIMTSDQ